MQLLDIVNLMGLVAVLLAEPLMPCKSAEVIESILKDISTGKHCHAMGSVAGKM